MSQRGMSRYWARGKFREHERGVSAECNSSLLSALQTSQVLDISTYAQLKHELILLFYNIIKAINVEVRQ